MPRRPASHPLHLRRRASSRDISAYRSRAEQHLKRFRQGSRLAVAITALLLLVSGGAPGLDAQPAADQAADASANAVASAGVLDEASRTLSELVSNAAA